MRSRDRLAEFRQRCACHDVRGPGDSPERSRARAESGAGPGSEAAAGTALADAHPELYRVLQEVERVQAGLQQLEQCTRQAAAHRAAPAAAAGVEEQLESLTDTSKRLGGEVCGALRALAALGVAAGDSAVAGRAARLQAAAWRARAAAVLAVHQQALCDARDSRHALLKKQIRLTNAEVTDEECEELLDSGNIAIFVQNVVSESAAARAALRAAEVRRGELQRVEAALRDVRDMFLQFAALVAAQQDSIDTIEYLSSQASRRVDAGGRELLQGSVTRRKTRKKKLSLLVCVATGVAIVLIVLLLT